MALSLKRMNWLAVAGVVTGGYAALVGYTLGWSRTWGFLIGTDDLNEVGDFIAGVFAPVALIWLVAAVLTQRQELNETREQFEKSQDVIDAQLQMIKAQNAQSAEEHKLAVANAKKAYRLSLFDKRFETYQKFITFGDEHASEDFTDASYWALIHLSYEAGFLFDERLEVWLSGIAAAIKDYLSYKAQHPYEMDDDGYGNRVYANTEENAILRDALTLRANEIREMYAPEERVTKFWNYIAVSDLPYEDNTERGSA